MNEAADIPAPPAYLAHEREGRLARERGDFLAALPHYRAAAEAAPEILWLQVSVATSLREIGRLDEAIEICRALLDQEPALASAHYELGQSLRRRGNQVGALESFRRAVEADSENKWFRSALAEALKECGLIDEAAEAFRMLLRKDSGFAHAHYCLGQIFRQQGERAQALASFRAAAALAPGNLWFRSDMAGALKETGDVDEAEAVFRGILQDDPDFAHAHYMLGQIFRQKGDRAGALASFQAAAALRSENLWFRNDMGGALRDIGRLDEAAEVFQDILRQDPGFAHAHYALGQVHRLKGAGGEALAAFQTAVALAPENVSFRSALAGELLAGGDIDAAAAEFHAMLRDNPRCGAAHHGLGQIFRQQGQQSEALAAFKAAAAAEQDNPWFANAVAAQLRDLGLNSEAEACAIENVARHPRLAAPLIELANCLRSSAPLDVVIGAWRQAEALEPGNHAIKCALAREYARAWRTHEAEILYDEVLAVQPSLIEANIGKGLIARQRGDRNAALAHFKRAADAGFSVWAHCELAQEYLFACAPEDARASLATALARAPTDRHLLMRAALIERALGARDRALDAFQALTQAHPRFAPAHVEIAKEQLELGVIEQGLASLKTALRLDPCDLGALHLLSDKLQQANRRDAALRVLYRAAVVRPQESWTLLAIARFEGRQGRLARALTLVDGLEKVLGPRPEIPSTKASLLQEFGFIGQAARELDNAMVAFPEHLQLRRQRATLAIAAPQRDVAHRLIEENFPCGEKESRELDWLKAQLAFSELDFASALDFAKKAIDVEPNETSRYNLAARAALFDFRIDEAQRHLGTLSAKMRPHGAMQGARSNPMELFTRELLTEWRLDREALDRALKARESSGRDRIEALARLVADFKDYTPAAIALFVELRRQNLLPRLDEARLAPRERQIPRRITQFWDEVDLPQDLEEMCDTWAINNISHHYRRFNLKTAEEYLRSQFAGPVLEAFMRAVEPAQKADIFRLAFLYAEGGYYADVDDRCVAPIDIIDPGGRDLLLHQEEIGSVGNNFIGAIPRHPIIGAALAQAVEAVNSGGRDTLWLATGPGMLTRVLAASIAQDVQQFIEDSNAPLILHREDLVRAVSIHCMASYKNSPRHWIRASVMQKRSRYTGDLDELCTLAGVAIGDESSAGQQAS